MGVIESRTFRNGNSVALRLPKELGFGPDVKVTIERNGDALTVRPLIDPAEEKRKVLALADALLALGPADEIEQRKPIEFPDRPGLY